MSHRTINSSGVDELKLDIQRQQMAEQLSEFDFSHGQPRRYDWKTLLNGSIWKLTQGDDFNGSVHTFRVGAYAAARRRGLKIRATLTETAIVIQAYK